jgi:hypothetical protein
MTQSNDSQIRKLDATLLMVIVAVRGFTAKNLEPAKAGIRNY